MDISSILYALVIIHAGYLIQLAFRQPSNKVIATPTESWLMWFAASPTGMVIARAIALIIALDHVSVALSLTDMWADSEATLHHTCPAPEYLDTRLFTWSTQTVASLGLLYLGTCLRLKAYAQLGSNFTYRIAKPDELVTSGMYAYVRHPSYTGLLMVLLAFYFLLIRPRGLVSCWAPLFDEKFVTDVRYAYLLPIIGFSCVIYLFMVRRVEEEEAMMEEEFGERWREHKARTKKFIPYVF